MEDFTEKEVLLLSVMLNQMDYLLRVSYLVKGDGDEITRNDLFDLACKLGIEKFME